MHVCLRSHLLHSVSLSVDSLWKGINSLSSVKSNLADKMAKYLIGHDFNLSRASFNDCHANLAMCGGSSPFLPSSRQFKASNILSIRRAIFSESDRGALLVSSVFILSNILCLNLPALDILQMECRASYPRS